jgi:hypothetical protein
MPFDGLPPAVQIVLTEDLDDFSTRSFSARWKRLAPELRRQSRWTLENFRYSDEAADNHDQSFFDVTASGTMNPLSVSSVCVTPICRQHAADQLARTLGIYADTVAIPDMLTRSLAQEVTPGHRHAAQAEERAAGQIAAIKRLRPLIANGIVRFRSGYSQFCPTHEQQFLPSPR